MTTQERLGYIWGKDGGVTDPGNVKYESGWVAEIPTYQNFNYVLQALTKNILVQAEAGTFAWQENINYIAGTTVLHGGQFWYCIQDHIGQNPDLDNTRSYWVLGFMLGGANRSDLEKQHGVLIKDVAERLAPSSWDSSDLTIENKNALVQLNTSNPTTNNLIFGNIAGELVVVDVGTQPIADGRSIAHSEPTVYKIFHEGNRQPRDLSGDTAITTSYDNTLSRLSADNVQVAIDLLADGVQATAIVDTTYFTNMAGVSEFHFPHNTNDVIHANLNGLRLSKTDFTVGIDKVTLNYPLVEDSDTLALTLFTGSWAKTVHTKEYTDSLGEREFPFTYTNDDVVHVHLNGSRLAKEDFILKNNTHVDIITPLDEADDILSITSFVGHSNVPVSIDGGFF